MKTATCIYWGKVENLVTSGDIEFSDFSDYKFLYVVNSFYNSKIHPVGYCLIPVVVANLAINTIGFDFVNANDAHISIKFTSTTTATISLPDDSSSYQTFICIWGLK